MVVAAGEVLVHHVLYSHTLRLDAHGIKLIYQIHLSLLRPTMSVLQLTSNPHTVHQHGQTGRGGQISRAQASRVKSYLLVQFLT